MSSLAAFVPAPAPRAASGAAPAPLPSERLLPHPDAVRSAHRLVDDDPASVFEAVLRAAHPPRSAR